MRPASPTGASRAAPPRACGRGMHQPGADAFAAPRIPRLRSDRSLESAAAAALEPDERSRRRAAYVPTDLDELNAVLCEGDLELIAGEVDFHANAVKKAVAVRACRRLCVARQAALTHRGAGAPAGAQGEARRVGQGAGGGATLHRRALAHAAEPGGHAEGAPLRAPPPACARRLADAHHGGSRRRRCSPSACAPAQCATTRSRTLTTHACSLCPRTRR